MEDAPVIERKKKVQGEKEEEVGRTAHSLLERKKARDEKAFEGVSRRIIWRKGTPGGH